MFDDVFLYVSKWNKAMSFNEWLNLKKKYRRSLKATPIVYNSYEYWKYNDEAIGLVRNIILLDGPDITSINFNNAMRYLWVIMHCAYYDDLDIIHARDDNNIEELVKMYKDAEAIIDTM